MTRLETDLLDLLKEDCRIPLEKLSVMTGATLEEVAATIEDLEKRRVILRYAPMINWDLTDRERVEAMIEVRVTPQRDMGFDGDNGKGHALLDDDCSVNGHTDSPLRKTTIKNTLNFYLFIIAHFMSK